MLQFTGPVGQVLGQVLMSCPNLTSVFVWKIKSAIFDW